MVERSTRMTETLQPLRYRGPAPLRAGGR
jgi:hypothetical protein